MRNVRPLLAAAALVLSTAAAHADLGDQLFKLLPDDGAEHDRFGISVAIIGATAIVGSYLDDDNGLDSGSAHLFNTTTGQQIAKLLPDDGAAGDWFGNPVAISDSTAIVGAWRDDDNGDDSGSAYLFDAAGCPENSNGDGMVTLCHIPPGNPDNAHTITMGANAAPGHLAHGDHCGPCEEDDAPPPPGGGAASHKPGLWGD